MQGIISISPIFIIFYLINFEYSPGENIPIESGILNISLLNNNPKLPSKYGHKIIIRKKSENITINSINNIKKFQYMYSSSFNNIVTYGEYSLIIKNKLLINTLFYSYLYLEEGKYYSNNIASSSMKYIDYDKLNNYKCCKNCLFQIKLEA